MLLALSPPQARWHSARIGCASPYDVVIRGGKIVDGTGNPWFEGDVAIRGDRIAAVGRIWSRESPPGGSSTRAAWSSRRGSSTCTRTPTCRCSRTATPRARSATASRPRSSARTPRPVRARGSSPRSLTTRGERAVATWTTLGGYFDALEARGISVNVASYVGLGTLLGCVLGDSLARPDAAQLEAMKELLDEAMRDGALGLSSMLAGPRELAVTTDDIVALAAVVQRHGGLFSSHIRNEGTETSSPRSRRPSTSADAPGCRSTSSTSRSPTRSLWHRMNEIVAPDRRGTSRGDQRPGQRLSVHARQQRSGHHHPALGSRGREGRN